MTHLSQTLMIHTEIRHPMLSRHHELQLFSRLHSRKLDLTDERVLIELLQVRGGCWRPVDDLPIIDVSLSEVFHGDVRSVTMLDCT